MNEEEEKNEELDDETLPQAKRRGRQGVDPGSQPSEFADEMRTNRFKPPPAPPRSEGKDE